MAGIEGLHRRMIVLIGGSQSWSHWRVSLAKCERLVSSIDRKSVPSQSVLFQYGK